MRRRAMRPLQFLVVVLACAWPGAFQPVQPARAAACETFALTGQVVCDPFLTYWRANGGVAQQGLPLTGEFTEIIDDQPYTVQYFQRARFEKHPKNAPPYDVLLGLLGDEQFRAKYPTPPQPFPTDPFNNPALPQECYRFPETG